MCAARFHGADALTARRLEREALAAYAEKDKPRFLARMTEAVALRPDHPRYLFHLAAALAVNEQPANAIATLGSIADLGVSWRVPHEEEFSSLWERVDFQRVLERLHDNQTRVTGTSEVAFELPSMSGLIEGIAWREKTGEFFFGDVHERCVWRRGAEGGVMGFGPADERVFGVFGLAIDEERGALWAASSAVPEMRGFASDQRGLAVLAEFDLATGALRRVVRAPDDGKPHVLGDLVVAPDGAVFATDSRAPVVWRLSPQADTLEAFSTSDEYLALQGLAFTFDGNGLWLTDYGNGLLHLDIATREPRVLRIPAQTTLLGCDGIARGADDKLILVQNGSSPTRILQITPNRERTAVEHVLVLAAAQSVMADATLGCIVRSQFLLIAEGGWNHFTAEAAADQAPRSVPIVRVRVE